MAAVKVIYYAGPPEYSPKLLHPLLKLLHKSREIEQVVLAYILIVVSKTPVWHGFPAIYMTTNASILGRNYLPLIMHISC